MFYCTKNGSERTPSSFIFRRMVRNKITKFWAFFSFTKLFGNGIPCSGESTTLAYAWSRLCTNFSSFYTTLVVREYSLWLCFQYMQRIFSYLDPLIVCLNLIVASSENLQQIFFIIELSKDHLIALNPYFTSALSCLKGQYHEIFDFCFFHESVPPSPWVFFATTGGKYTTGVNNRGLGTWFMKKTKSKISTLSL